MSEHTMMVELPRMENGEQYPLCSTCAAKCFIGGKYYCDESKLNGSGKPPFHCPKYRNNTSVAIKGEKTTVVQTALKNLLRRV